MPSLWVNSPSRQNGTVGSLCVRRIFPDAVKCLRRIVSLFKEVILTVALILRIKSDTPTTKYGSKQNSYFFYHFLYLEHHRSLVSNFEKTSLSLKITWDSYIVITS